MMPMSVPRRRNITAAVLPARFMNEATISIIAAIAENDYYMDNCKKIIATRTRTAEALRKMGFTVIDSSANFIFAKSDLMGGAELYESLKQRGILVRHFTKARIAEYNRITIGTDAEMDALLSTIAELIKEKQS